MRFLSSEVNLFLCFRFYLIQDPRPEYKLFGTIVHSGYSQESGHYYAYIKVAYAVLVSLNVMSFKKAAKIIVY